MKQQRASFVAVWAVLLLFVNAAAAAPANLGGGLRELALQYEARGAIKVTTSSPDRSAAERATPGLAAGLSSLSRGGAGMKSALDGLRLDAHGRIAVSIQLDGTRSLADTSARLQDLGAEIVVARYLTRFGEISAFVPIEKVSQMAAAPGVRSMLLSHARFHVGAVTSEGAHVLHTDVENLRGFTGRGITVGALSNSYNTSGPITAQDDVASGDLPGVGNPLGHTQPVVVVLEDPKPRDDEGRALLQVVHDLAPDAKLCFATADIDPISFASAILDLADSVHGCGADVLVDDVGYDTEPYFSDGLIANTVNAVVSAGVSYHSSAGNDNQESYDSRFRRISDEQARRLNTLVQLQQVPASLTAGGFHNLGTEDHPDIVQQVSTEFGADFLVMQWNDPWLVGGITARYVILVFDSQGNWLNNPDDPNGLGGVDDTFATDVAFQEAFLPGPTASNPAPVYYIAYARASTQPTRANHFRSLAFFGSGTYLTHTLPLSPQVYGHTAATGAVSVAADYWNDTKGTEFFSSLGPVTIYFDAQGNRLERAVTRLKPDVTAVDGVHTTFFGGFVDNSGFPSFFGTSAAAPHSAGVAALLLQAAGGPGSLSPAAVKNTLIRTAHAHPAHDGQVSGDAREAGLEVSLSARGFLLFDPFAFSLAFHDSSEHRRTLLRLDIDLTPAGLTAGSLFAVGDLGRLQPSDVSLLTTVFPNPVVSLGFAPGAFRSGDRISFGFPFGEASILALGGNASVLAGSRFRATFSDGTAVTGTLNDALTHDWSFASGFGLIDARTAIDSLH